MSAPFAASRVTRRRLGWIPVALLLLGLAATGVLLFLLSRDSELQGRQRFERAVDGSLAILTGRLNSYTALLQSAAALVAARGDMDRIEFKAYATRLGLHAVFAGMQGLGYSERVQPDEVPRLEMRIRASGVAGFHIWPTPASGERFPIIALEPADRRNNAAIGFDMYSEPVRRTAMLCARDTGLPCASGPVTLVQEIDQQKQAGFLIFVPVFGAETAPTARVRERTLRGYVYAPFRADDLVRAAFPDTGDRLVELELFDEADGVRQRLAGTVAAGITTADGTALTRAFPVAGRTWSANFVPGPGLVAASRAGWLPTVLASGVVVSVLLSGLAWSQLRARQADERAAQLEQRQQAVRAGILESITDAFYAVDREWRYTYVNQHALDYYRLPADQLLGHVVWDVFPAARGSVFEEQYRRAVRERVSVTFETLSPVSGRRLEVHAYPSDEGLSVYFQDVTDRHVQQARLADHAAAIARLNRDLEDRVDEFETLLEVLPVGIGIAFDPECRRITTNRAFAELLRLPHGQNASLSAPAGERPQHFRVLRDGREIPASELPLQVAARDGLTIEGVELEVRFDDDTRRQLLEYAAPLFDDQGRPRGSVGAFVDVTARVAAEETFRTMANSAPVLVWITDTTKAYIWFNEPWLRFTGRTMDQEVGAGWTTGIHPDDADACLRTYRSAFDRRQPFSMEYRLRRADGSFRWLLDHGEPLKRGGVFTGYIGSCIDITDRKGAELEHARLLQEVREANRLKDEFLATLSHELRTPLNAILGWTRMLRTRSLPAESAARALEIVERNATVQTQLVEEILDMSRIVTGKLRLDLRAVDLHDVLTAAIDAVRPAADAKGVRVEAASEAGIGHVLGDFDRLQQAVWNLLTNAIKFTPRGGRVEVRLQRVDSHIEASVGDTGIGIEPGFLPFIFDRFRQADATCTRSSTGLGLGLSIVKHVVEAHGGTVEASSGGLDHGATFRLRLPLPVAREGGWGPDGRRQPRAESADVVATEIVRTRLQGARILAVDDEPDGLSLVVTVLRDAGAEVVGETSAIAALARLETWRPDVIVTDIGMPEMDGWELMRRLRQRPAGAGGHTPVAALTAYARSEDSARALREGFDLHLAKPIDPLALVVAIATLVDQRTSAASSPARGPDEA